MVAGRELDALIAEKVMGLKPTSPPKYEADRFGETVGSSLEMAYWVNNNPKPYSTSIEAAWAVVEKLCPEINGGFSPQFELQTQKGIEVNWTAQFYDRFGNAPWAKKDGAMALGFGDTAPHAICLAALKAVE